MFDVNRSKKVLLVLKQKHESLSLMIPKWNILSTDGVLVRNLHRKQ